MKATSDDIVLQARELRRQSVQMAARRAAQKIARQLKSKLQGHGLGVDTAVLAEMIRVEFEVEVK